MEHVLKGIKLWQLHEVCTPYHNSTRKNCFFIIRINNALKSFTHRYGWETSFSNSSHCCFTPIRQLWRTKQSRSSSLKFSKSKMLSVHYKNESAFNISNAGRFPLIIKTNLQKEPTWFKFWWEIFSFQDVKTPRETPGFSINFSTEKEF